MYWLLKQTFRQKTLQKGFTLLELLIVVVILGILAAMAVPQLLAQVAKARESEAKQGLGVLNRAQIAYRFEHSIFANIGKIGPDGVIVASEMEIPLNPKYYQFEDLPKPGTDAERVKHGAIPVGDTATQLRMYSGGVRQMPSDNNFATVICRANSHTQTKLVDIRPILSGGVWGCYGESQPL